MQQSGWRWMNAGCGGWARLDSVPLPRGLGGALHRPATQNYNMTQNTELSNTNSRQIQQEIKDLWAEGSSEGIWKMTTMLETVERAEARCVRNADSVWRGREVVRGGVRECASDSCPHSGAGPRTYVSLFLVVLEETFLKSFCRPRPLMIYTVEKFV